MTDCNGERLYDVEISCVPRRGWVAVQAVATVELQNPIVEFSILSPGGHSLASTLVMDAPQSFRVTLHLSEVQVGTSLRLQMKLIKTEDASVAATEVLPFTFQAQEED